MVMLEWFCNVTATLMFSGRVVYDSGTENAFENLNNVDILYLEDGNVYRPLMNIKNAKKPFEVFR